MTGPADRPPPSSLPVLPDYAEALRCALSRLAPLGRTERLPLDAAGGRVLDAAVLADRDLPPFDRAQMDGYALRGAEVGHRDAWPVVRTIAAGHPPGDRVEAGHCVAIATGAALPEGVDTVIQHELSDRADPVRFTITRVEVGRAVHPCGADARKGDTLIASGTVLGSHHLGLAAAAGCGVLAVRERPRATVLTSGDEVLGIDTRPETHQIRNSNAPQATELLRRVGAEPIAHEHVLDDAEATTRAVGRAIAESDLVVTIGGISAGERDHFPDSFAAHDIDLDLRGAAIQPGRPVITGRAPGGAVVVGLPGNPVSSLACGCLFVWPIVRVLLGLEPDLPWREMETSIPVRPNPRRRAFRPARIERDGRVTVPAWAGSGDLAHTTRTDGLLELVAQNTEIPAGTRLRFLPWP